VKKSPFCNSFYNGTGNYSLKYIAILVNLQEIYG